MKHFLRSLITSLMIGIPIVIIGCVFLYLNQDSSSLSNVQEESVHISNFFNKDNASITSELDQSSDYESEVETTKNRSSVTLSFAGDVHFSELIIQNYDKNGLSAVVDDQMLSYMQNADLFMLNHEFVFSNRGEAMEDKEYTLRNDPKYVKILQELGTDLVSLANNHVLDFGQEAFLDTLDTLNNAEISYVGGGKNFEEASSPMVQNINGQSFAFLAASRVAPSADWYAGKSRPGVFQTYDSTAFNHAISDADPKYDHVIVFVHWGIERSLYPEDYQRKLAKEYIDAGADLVIGCHPHILQGFEYYKDVPIVYSLGNYLFGNRSDETILLNAEFDQNGDLTLKMIPCKRVNGTLKPMEDTDKLFNHLTDLSYGAALSHGGTLIKFE